MPRVIRQSVFETNSSSCHSITIADGDFVADRLPVDPDGVCRIQPGEFGWGVDEHFDAATKASYCLTWVKGAPDYGQDTTAESEMLTRVVKAEMGAAGVEYVQSESEYHPWGYIDHQSIETGWHNTGKEAFASEDTLRRFIFNRTSKLRISNDNGGEDDE